MSFQRRSFPNVLAGVRPGTVPTTSTGIPQLDPLLGGGIPLGSTLLLAEDTHNVYGRHLMKAFVAEGIAHGQRIFVINGESTLRFEELPRKVAYERSNAKPQGITDKMKIAFRYERLLEVESLPEAETNHVFDYGLPIRPEELEGADVHSCNAVTKTPAEILCLVASNISKGKVLRVAVTVGLLVDHKFLRSLRVLARNENVVCWVSVPACLDDDSFRRLFAMADCAISLVAFSSAERQANPLYKNYHGLLSLDKFAEINSVTSHRPESTEYIFHQTGRRFAIERLHMPPDLGSPGGPAPALTMSCQTSGGSKALDF